MDEIDSLLMGDERDDLDDGVEDNANEEERPMKQNQNKEEGGTNFLDDLNVGNARPVNQLQHRNVNNGAELEPTEIDFYGGGSQGEDNNSVGIPEVEEVSSGNDDY